MSAYTLDRSVFLAIARFIDEHADRQCGRTIHVYHPDFAAKSHRINAEEAANVLLLGNLESVAYRYKQMLEDYRPIRASQFHATKVPEPAAMFGPLRSLQYQSCERDDYNDSAAYAVLIEVLWLAGQAAAAQVGAPAWA